MQTSNYTSIKNRVVGALFDAYWDSIDSEMRYREYGFQDIEPDSDDFQFDKQWGPAKGVLTVEGQTYGSNQKYKDYPKSVTYRKYTSRLEWTEEMLHWLSKGSQQKMKMQVKNMVAGAVNALHANINDDVAKFFYLGHGTTFYTGGDGVAIYSGSHPLRAGGTHSNIFPSGETHKPFGSSALVDAVTLVNRFVGQNGRKLLPSRHIRIIGSEKKLPAIQKVVDSLYGPDNANLGLQAGSAAAFAKRGVTVDYISLPDMPSAYDEYWFLVAMDRAVDSLFLAWMWKPRMANDTTISNGTYENDSSTMFGPVSIGWQFTFGSKGDNSSIS